MFLRFSSRTSCTYRTLSQPQDAHHQEHTAIRLCTFQLQDTVTFTPLDVLHRQISSYDQVNNVCQQPGHCILFSWHNDLTDGAHLSVSDPLIMMPHPQDGQEGEDNDRAVAKSRPARNLCFSCTCTVVLAIMFGVLILSARRVPIYVFQSSNVVGMEKPGAPALSTDDVSTSPERQTTETNKSAW